MHLYESKTFGNKNTTFLFWNFRTYFAHLYMLLNTISCFQYGNALNSLSICKWGCFASGSGTKTEYYTDKRVFE